MRWASRSSRCARRRWPICRQSQPDRRRCSSSAACRTRACATAARPSSRSRRRCPRTRTAPGTAPTCWSRPARPTAAPEQLRGSARRLQRRRFALGLGAAAPRAARARHRPGLLRLGADGQPPQLAARAPARRGRGRADRLDGARARAARRPRARSAARIARLGRMPSPPVALVGGDDGARGMRCARHSTGLHGSDEGREALALGAVQRFDAGRTMPTTRRCGRPTPTR